MSTHNICFHTEISKIICDTPSYLELCNLGLCASCYVIVGCLLFVEDHIYLYIHHQNL